jgi:glycosyltransferase involved in cell wall biosynthesis
MTNPPNDFPVLIGSPFFRTGRGGTVLGFLRAFREIQMPVTVCDAFSRRSSENVDPSVEKELEGVLVPEPGRNVNIYHVNCDEIDIAQAHLQRTLPDGAYNIIYPFWELGGYPPVWLEKLNRFDEIWAPSLFIEEALKKSIEKPICHVPLPVQPRLSSFLGRRFFNLPESAYCLLFFFDFRSYIDRKNPNALLDVFERISRTHPEADIRFVIKIHGAAATTKTIEDYNNFVERIRTSAFCNKIILIDRIFTDNEIKNLVRCCDCFVSLHRSEGFGLGMAEAMYLGKPVIATGYSGNMDFMNRENSFLVDYHLIPVPEGRYPYHEGLVWADPDLDQALTLIIHLFTHPEEGRIMGQKASRHIRTNFSFLSIGLQAKKRLMEIAGERQKEK